MQAIEINVSNYPPYIFMVNHLVSVTIKESGPKKELIIKVQGTAEPVVFSGDRVGEIYANISKTLVTTKIS